MIIQIKNMQELTQCFADGLVDLYQEIFSEAPYYEVFSDKKVETLFASYFEKGVLFVKYVNEEIVGFSAAVPFLKSSLFQTRINKIGGKSTAFTIDFLEKELGFLSERTWCLEDLGVKRNHRSKGFGFELTLAQFQVLKTGTTTILRTSQFNNNSVINFYRNKFKFEYLNITQDVQQLRQDGTVRHDRRIFMATVI